MKIITVKQFSRGVSMCNNMFRFRVVSGILNVYDMAVA